MGVISEHTYGFGCGLWLNVRKELVFDVHVGLLAWIKQFLWTPRRRFPPPPPYCR